MAGLVNANRLLLQKIRPVLHRRLVSTSKKNNDTIAAEVTKTAVKPEEKNWISYGFETKSKEADRIAMHSIMFATITLILTVGGFYMAYVPDFNLRDWAVREAFLELRRREAAGLPLIDCDLIPADKICLPTDEELGDTEIII